MDVLDLNSYTEDCAPYHEARLLLIIDAFTSNGLPLTGITKLVKLDFLLRYPTYLEHALRVKKASVRKLDVQPYERQSIESSMVRYKYGPWDARYRQWLNGLASRGLIEISITGRTVRVVVTDEGSEVASRLRSAPEYALSDNRIATLKTHFDMGATGLMKFIYRTFPAITSMRLGEEIKP